MDTLYYPKTHFAKVSKKLLLAAHIVSRFQVERCLVLALSHKDGGNLNVLGTDKVINRAD